MYPPIEEVAREVILGKSSKVPAASVTGGPPDPRNPPAPYNAVSMGVGFNISKSQEAFQEIHEQFLRAKDVDGVPMLEIARKYWDDPEWAEYQRREIAERKQRRGRSS